MIATVRQHRNSRLRIATGNEIIMAAAILTDVDSRLRRYCSEMLSHPIAGPSLRNYSLLTECSDLVGKLGLSDADRFWSQYYWLARFTMEWTAIAGYDAGLEQQLFQLLEHAHVDCESLAEVQAAVANDAVLPPRMLYQTRRTKKSTRVADRAFP